MKSPVLGSGTIVSWNSPRTTIERPVLRLVSVSCGCELIDDPLDFTRGIGPDDELVRAVYVCQHIETVAVEHNEQSFTSNGPKLSGAPTAAAVPAVIVAPTITATRQAVQRIPPKRCPIHRVFLQPPGRRRRPLWEGFCDIDQPSPWNVQHRRALLMLGSRRRPLAGAVQTSAVGRRGHDHAHVLVTRDGH